VISSREVPCWVLVFGLESGSTPRVGLAGCGRRLPFVHHCFLLPPHWRLLLPVHRAGNGRPAPAKAKWQAKPRERTKTHRTCSKDLCSKGPLLSRLCASVDRGVISLLPACTAVRQHAAEGRAGEGAFFSWVRGTNLVDEAVLEQIFGVLGNSGVFTAGSCFDSRPAAKPNQGLGFRPWIRSPGDGKAWRLRRVVMGG